jgi:hypothetical protein
VAATATTVGAEEARRHQSPTAAAAANLGGLREGVEAERAHRRGCGRRREEPQRAAEDTGGGGNGASGEAEMGDGGGGCGSGIIGFFSNLYVALLGC